MPRWDRMDICEAWYAYAKDHHTGINSWQYAIFGRLWQLGFRPGLSVREDGYDGLTDNGKEIYRKLVGE